MDKSETKTDRDNKERTEWKGLETHPAELDRL